MLIALDGTYQDQHAETNVFKFYQAYERNHPSGKNLYIEGVGADVRWLQHIAGGIFGAGEKQKVDEAFAWLKSVMLLAPSQPIDIVGFSRGAATALDLADRIHRDTSYSIRFLGLWDTVAAFGVANLGFYFSKVTWGHHLKLPADRITFCHHAMALDECRPPFAVTRLDGAREVWFRGVHGDVGGGRSAGLSNLTLRWMYRKATAAGLPITEADALGLSCDGSLEPSTDAIERLGLQRRKVRTTDRVHYSVQTYTVNPRESEQDELRVEAVKAAPAIAVA